MTGLGPGRTRGLITGNEIFSSVTFMEEFIVPEPGGGGKAPVIEGRKIFEKVDDPYFWLLTLFDVYFFFFFRA